MLRNDSKKSKTYNHWLLQIVVPEDEVGDVAGGCEDSVGEQPEVKGEQELGGELGEELVPGLLHKFCIKYIAFLQVYM